MRNENSRNLQSKNKILIARFPKYQMRLSSAFAISNFWRIPTSN